MQQHNKERFMYILGGGIVGLFVLVLIILVFQPLPERNHDIINIALGSLSTMAGGVVGYFFGSSKSSADKTEILAGKGSGATSP